MAQIYEIVLKNQQQVQPQQEIVTQEQVVSDVNGTMPIVKQKIKPTVSPTPKIKIGGGNRTGVEHNKYERAINTTLNRFTGGLWERGSRISKSAYGLLVAGSSVGATILFKEMLDSTFKYIIEPLQKQAQERNDKDILKIRTGNLTLGANYDMSVNFITGRRKYKNNS